MEVNNGKTQEISVSLIARRNIINKEELSHDEIANAVVQLSHVRLDREHVKVIDNLECLGKVTNLYLQHNDISEIESLETLPHVRFLTLANNKISQIKNLNCLKDLKFLDLSDNKINDISIDELPAGLVILNLEGNPCTGLPDYRSRIFRALPDLKQLDGKPVTRKDRYDAGCQMDDSASDSEEDDDDDDDDEEMEEKHNSRCLSRIDPEQRLVNTTNTGGLKQHADDIIARAKIRAKKEDAAHGRRLAELAALRTDAIKSARQAKGHPISSAKHLDPESL